MSTPFINIYRGNMPAHASGGGGGFGGGGGGGGGTTYYYYDMEDCADGTTFVGRSTTSGLSVGDSFSYGLASDPDCAKITGTNSTATSGTGFITSYADCCGCMEANKCRSTSGFTTPTSAHTVYASGNLQQVIGTQVTPAPGYPSGYVINEYTKVTVEGELGGRTVQSAVLSDFGASTSTYPMGASTTVYHAYDDSSNQCFTNATETIRWRLKVECGSWSGSAITSCSTAYTAWQSATVDHSSAGEQCTGGTLYEFTDCFDSSTHLVEDQSGYSLSVGDFVDVYDSSSNQRCGTITATNQSGSANGAYINGDGYSSCSDCVSSTGISNPQLYTATDCNNSSTSYILADDQYNVLPSTGDVVLVYLNSGDYACVSITGTTSSGTSAGYLESSETNCASCLSNNGLQQHEVEDCNSGATHIVTDSGGMVYSVGDVISYTDKATASTVYCGTVTAMDVSGTAAYDYSSGYNDCADCNSSEGL